MMSNLVEGILMLSLAMLMFVVAAIFSVAGMLAVKVLWKMLREAE